MTTTKKDFTNLDRRTFLRTVGVAAAVGVAGTALPINTVSWAKTGGTLSMLIQPEVPTLASYPSTSDRKSLG